MTHHTSSLTGTTTRSPLTTWRAGAPIIFKNITRAPPHPKANKEQDTSPEKRALRRPFSPFFSLSFLSFLFPSLPPQHRKIHNGEQGGPKYEGQKQQKMSGANSRPATYDRRHPRQTTHDRRRAKGSIFVLFLKRAKLRCRAATSLSFC